MLCLKHIQHIIYVHQLGNTNTVSMCVQVAFIIAGIYSTHAVYYKTLKHALGIEAVGAPVFMDMLHAMHSIDCKIKKSKAPGSIA